jgi:hypothetical protein
LDFAESKYDNQIALSPTNFKGGGIIFKKYVSNEKVIGWFLIAYAMSNNEQCLCLES